MVIFGHSPTPPPPPPNPKIIFFKVKFSNSRGGPRMKYITFIEEYCFKFQKLPFPLIKLEEFAKNSQIDLAEKCFI